MTTNRLDEARALMDQTLVAIELRQESLTQIVLRCLRIARLIARDDVSGWLQCELRGYEEHSIARFPNWADYVHWSGRNQSKGDDGRWTYEPAPIELVESRLARAKADHAAAATVPPAIPEPSQTGITERVRGATATERVLAQNRVSQYVAAAEIDKYARIVASLRGEIYGWLTQEYIHLQYGAIVDSAFARTKERFDGFLVRKAPAVGKALAAAFSRSYSRDSEELSQAITSCRRALKALADTLYPPTDERPSGRDLSDDKYKNRLVQFVAENVGPETQGAVFEAEIELVATRADALNDLVSKGVHAEVDQLDLELAVVHTYLLAGELLSLLPAEEPDAPPTAVFADGNEQAAVGEDGVPHLAEEVQQASLGPKEAEASPQDSE